MLPYRSTNNNNNRALSIAAEMEALAQALVAKQEAVVVPVVAAYLPAKEQKRFNNKVCCPVHSSVGRIGVGPLLVSQPSRPDDD